MKGPVLKQDVEGKLSSRIPTHPPETENFAIEGVHKLNLEPAGRDGILYVPPAAVNIAAPLILFLHGAGDNATRFLPELRDEADRFGTVLLIPESRNPRSWDIIVDRHYSADVEFIDRALGYVFGGKKINPSKVAIAGFSDGASYALSLGLINGTLFSHILAFSPGFVASPVLQDNPAIFLSHGTYDRILPIDTCGRKVLQRLNDMGYRSRYLEFEDPEGHALLPKVVHDAMEYFLSYNPSTVA